MTTGRVFLPRTVGWVLLIVGGLALLITVVVLYSTRADRPVLYYYGAAPEEAPQGPALAILNPLRNKKDERNAEWLIRDLRTERCEVISKERLAANPTRICPTMRGNIKARLVWLDPESDTTRGGSRKMIYDLPDRRARLVVYFGADEAGWGAKTVSIVQ